MGQVVSFIFGCCFGCRTNVENRKPIPNEGYSPSPSYYIDIVEEPSLNNAAAALEKERHYLLNDAAAAVHENDESSVPIFPQQQPQQEAVSNPVVEDDLQKPLIATDHSIVNTVSVGGNKDDQFREIVVERTKKLIIQAEEGATSTKTRKKKKSKKTRDKKDGVRKIGPYNSKQKILLAGEGDFSFSASLAVAFGNASNIVATSLNDKDFLRTNYKKAMSNIMELKSRGSLVIHRVDATKMADHKSLRGMKFDRIIFNFPHAGFFAHTAHDLSQNQKLVCGFLRNAKNMIKKDGEIHITHKTSRVFIMWNIADLASKEGLCLIQECPFDPKVFPGYDTKYGYGGDKNFDYFPCTTFKFGLRC